MTCQLMSIQVNWTRFDELLEILALQIFTRSIGLTQKALDRIMARPERDLLRRKVLAACTPLTPFTVFC
jgi:hypothetical protein